ncbi:hypothetical protein HYY71_04850 [Candidatus Woesearchaeota archaeon]|nr:hypothetical protein [Candidatus Woesearchaeota archaeon]
MGTILEVRIAAEIKDLLRHSDAISSPWKYGVNMGLGMTEYAGIVMHRRHALKMGDLLEIYARHVNDMQELPEPEDKAARIQGAFYMNNLIHEILTHRIDENYAIRTLRLENDVVKEIEAAYHKLGNVIVSSILESDPDIVQPGQEINIDAVRPKKPKDAIRN